MSNVHEGPLATYNSLLDKNLSGYFGNTRMRRHLKKAGLVNRRGELVTENQYRVNMARKEHKKHVKDLLAQAIVHKTLDLERFRQVEIKKKLEEISKIELVRRVRAGRGRRQDFSLMPLLTPKPPKIRRDVDRSVVPKSIPKNIVDLERPEMKDNLQPSSATKHSNSRDRKGDEDVLPYLSPRSMSRPQSVRPSESSSSKRPKSAPPPRKNRSRVKSGHADPYEEVIYVDNDGRPVSPPPASSRQSLKDMPTEGIDSRHLYALDSEALQQYALKLSRAERGREGATSPYLITQMPQPPKQERVKSARSPRRSARLSARPEGPVKERRSGGVRGDHPDIKKRDPNTVEGSLMLHRQEPAMMHQGEVQTLCEITMKYHGPNLTLPRDQHDPTQEVSIEQQHCGGNTLPVFKEKLQAGSTFSFLSRRHRGYPFSLTMYIDGRVDCRVSTCCEYKHAVGVKLGGKMGHFSLVATNGATPCYKCKLSCQAPPRSLKLKKSTKGKRYGAEKTQEEVTVDGTPRSPVTEMSKAEIAGKSDDDENCEKEKKVVIQVEEDGDQSRVDNSTRSVANTEKFEHNKRATDKKTEKEASEEDSGKHSVKTEDTNNETEDIRNLNIVALEKTETDIGNETENLDQEKEDRYDINTDDEVAEEILSERTDDPRSDHTEKAMPDTIDESLEEADIISKGSNCSIEEEIENKEISDDSIIEEVPNNNDGFDSVFEEIAEVEAVNAELDNYKHQRDETIDDELKQKSATVISANEEPQLEKEVQDNETKETPQQNDNYEDDFEEDDKGVPISVDIKDASDIEILNKVNQLGKRIVLEVSEESPENISAVIDYNEDSDIVYVKKFQRTVPRDLTDDEAEGETGSESQLLPLIIEELERQDQSESTADEYYDPGMIAPQGRNVYGLRNEDISVPFSSTLEPHISRSGNRNKLKRSKSDAFSMQAKAGSVTSSASLSSRSSRSTKSMSIQSVPTFGTALQENQGNRLARPQSAWGRNPSSLSGGNVKQVPKLKHQLSMDIPDRPQSAWGQYSDQNYERSLRPVTPRRSMSFKEKADYETLRAQFYPPAHDCLGKERHRQEMLRKPQVKRRQKSRERDIDISIESRAETMAKTEDRVDTVIAGIPADDSEKVQMQKRKNERVHINIPGADIETADEVSDLELDARPKKPARPINVNINVDITKKETKRKSRPVKKEAPAMEEPGVSKAYAKYILKRPDKASKNRSNQRMRSPSRQRRGSSPKRARSPSPKRKLDLTKAKKEIDFKVEEGKAELEKVLRESLEIFGSRLQAQQEEFAEQLQNAHNQFAGDLSEAQASLSGHGNTIKASLEAELLSATDAITSQLGDSQKVLKEQLDDTQQVLSEQLQESQSMLAKQFTDSQNTFGELVKDSQIVLGNQLKDSQQIFGDQVQDSQKVLADQMLESQKTLTAQMQDMQVVLTGQLKDSQNMIADQVKESQQLIADQLKQSQGSIAEQLKNAQSSFAVQVSESKESFSDQFTDSQNKLSDQLSSAKQQMSDDLSNSQNVLAKQLEDQQKTLSDQLATSQQTIDRQLTDTQSKISEQLIETQKQIDDHLVETLEKIGNQESEAKERLKKESEDSRKKIMQQEEETKQRMQQESEESQKRLQEQEQAARDKMQKEAEETQQRLAEQEAKAKEEMERERIETQRRLEEQEMKAKEQLQKESEETQKRLAEQEALAAEKLQKESEETQRRLAEQEEKAKEEMKKESEESARRLVEQENAAKENLKKEGEDTAQRLAEQEKKVKEEMTKQSQEAAEKLAAQELAAREQLQKESEETQTRLAQQEAEAREQMKKESEDAASRLAEQEASAKESLVQEGVDSARRLAEQEQKARADIERESAETAQRLKEQEDAMREGLQKEVQASASKINEAVRVVEEAKQQTVDVAKSLPDKNQNYLDTVDRGTKNKYDDDFESDNEEDKSDRRQIIGLRADEERQDGKTISIDVKQKEEEENKEGLLPPSRRIEGYSSEDEDIVPKQKQMDVTVDKTERKRRSSSSSSSSSDSSHSSVKESSTRDKTPEKSIVTTKAKNLSARSEESNIPQSDRTDRSTTSTTSGALTTETESTISDKKTSTKASRKHSSSSSSSTLSSDSEDEKYMRKKREEKRKLEEEKRRKEDEERENERKRKAKEEERKRKELEEERERERRQKAEVEMQKLKLEEVERNKRLEEDRLKREEQARKLAEERRLRQEEWDRQKREEEKRKENEKHERMEHEERIKRNYERQLSEIQIQRESEMSLDIPKDVLTEDKPEEKKQVVVESKAKQESSSSTSSSSSESETESERDKKKVPVPPVVPKPSPSVSTPASNTNAELERPATSMQTVVETGKTLKSSSSSSGSSSSSESEDEHTKPGKVVEARTVETKVESAPPVEVKKDSSSSGSSSSSDSESDEDNKNVKTPPSVPVVPVVTESQPPPPPQPVQQEAQKKAETSTESSSSGSSSSETEPDTPKPVQKTVEPTPAPPVVEPERVFGLGQEEQAKPKQQEPPKAQESEDSSSDSSSSDSSSDSDSDSEDEGKKQKLDSKKGKTDGGLDPENVAGERASSGSHLAQSSVKEPQSREGSILPLITDQTSVELSTIRLDESQVTELGNYIASSGNIRSITVRNTRLDDGMFGNLMMSLEVSQSKPRLLNFSLNQLGLKSMMPLSKAIRQNPSLEILILNGNPIGNGGCKVLVNSFLNTKDPFPFLRRSSGYFTPSEARSRAEEGEDVSYENTDIESNIKELDLGGTKLSDAGITEIARLIEKCKTLESLNLNGNVEITPVGWECLGKALQKNTTLKTLSLDFTRIGDEGLEGLVKGLSLNTTLKSLELESSGLTERGGQILCELLKSNTSIIELTATPGNDISASTLNQIRQYLALNNTQ